MQRRRSRSNARWVEAGEHDVALVGGVERCTPQATGTETSGLTRIFGSGVHDFFTGAEILALDATGLFADGDAGPATEAGRTRLGGEVIVNPSGG